MIDVQIIYYEEKQKELMEEWKTYLNAEDGVRTFTADGIIDPEKWFARTDKQERILFILKESYNQVKNADGTITYPKRISDLAKWICHKPCMRAEVCFEQLHCSECKVPGSSYNALALLTYGIDEYCNSNELTPDGADNGFRSDREAHWHSIAIVNIKKADGEKISDDADLYFHAMHDQAFIRRQIKLINPTLIICCGTYDILRCIYISEDNGKGIDIQSSSTKRKIGSINNINIIGTRHSNRANYEELYTDVMTSYKEIKTKSK